MRAANRRPRPAAQPCGLLFGGTSPTCRRTRRPLRCWLPHPRRMEIRQPDHPMPSPFWAAPTRIAGVAAVRRRRRRQSGSGRRAGRGCRGRGRSARSAGGRRAGQDLRIAKRHAPVQGVGDRRVPQRVRADVARDPCGLRDPRHHPVDVAPVCRLAGDRAQHQRPGGALAAAGLQHRSTGTISGMVAGLFPLPTRCRTRWPRNLSA